MKKILKFSLLIISILTISIQSCEKDDSLIVDTKYISEDITSNTTWESKYLYIVEQSIDITNDATLTIEPGTTIRFKAGKYMTVSYSSNSYGNIKALGTAAKPIIFTSDATSKNKGDWAGVWLYDGCNASEFRFCTFEFAGGDNWSGGDGGITINGGKNASIENCIFSNSASYGFRAYSSPNALSSFTSNTFLLNEVNDVKIYAYNMSSFGTGNSYEKEIDIYGTDINTIGDVTWKNQNADLIVAGDIMVGSTQGTKLILEPGTTLKFTSNGELGVGYSSNIGIIKAIGTGINPITFTTSSNYPAKGDWDGIWFYTGSTSGSIFDHCVISYGGGYSGNKTNVSFKFETGDNVTIQNSEISHSEGYGLAQDQPSTDTHYPTLSNNVFIDNTLGDKNW